MTRVRSAIFALVILLLPACETIGPHPVTTTTGLGQPVTQTEPERTDDRKNVPTGVKPDDIVAHVKTKTGGETWVDKKGNVFQNEQAREENAAPPDRPARAWYYWPIRILAGIAVLVCIITLLYLRGLLAPILKFFKRS